MRTIECIHCGRIFISNRKLKHIKQRYGGMKECQKARRRKVERDKYQNDPSYRSRKLEKSHERKKLKKINGDSQYYSDYQRAYRTSHPEYVLQNKVKQRERYARKKASTSLTTKIVNPDTLILQPADNEQVYAMFAIDCKKLKKIVNPGTLMLEQIGMLSFTNKKPLFVRLL